jgi:hypothetical protein
VIFSFISYPGLSRLWNSYHGVIMRWLPSGSLGRDMQNLRQIVSESMEFDRVMQLLRYSMNLGRIEVVTAVARVERASSESHAAGPGVRRSISVTISRTEHEAAALHLCHSPASFSPSQQKPCPRFPPMLPPPLPTFNRSSMPPWMCMRRRQKPSFLHIPLPPNSSPATRPPPFYPFCKTSSSNLIAVAVAMRG